MLSATENTEAEEKTMLNEDMTKDILYFDNLKYSLL